MARGRGYLVVDHRFSPGLPENVAREAGYDPNLTREGKLYEIDTLTCSHCKVVVVPNPLRKLERSKCAKCGWHYICDVCAFQASMPDYDHTPFDKKVELASSEIALGSPPKLLMP